MSSESDRRARKRVAAAVPVRVRTGASAPEVAAETRDVSTNGVFFYTKSRMVEGAEVELVLILPAD